MSVLSNVTVKTLKKNRVRTLVTIIGIILSTAMFTAVASIVSSFLSYYVRAVKFTEGDYHVALQHCEGKLVSSVAADPRVSVDAHAEYLGYAEIDSQNEYKPYLCVLGANDTFFERMAVNLIEGRLPENENELLIPEHLEYNGGVRYSVGEKLELGLGTRLVNHFAEYQNISFKDNEVLAEEKSAVFTVVGIYTRPGFENYDAPGYTALTRKNELSLESEYQFYFKVDSPRKNLEAFIDDHELESGKIPCAIHLNTALLMAEGHIRSDNAAKAIIGLAAILCVLIFIGSVSLIYNAFSISVSERTKQFGILSSVGATRKQLRSSVLHEALVLCGIGVPLGILAGIAGTGLTLHLLKGAFASLTTQESYKGVLALDINLYAILISMALSFITVLVSAWIPSKRAMRTSPMEAIRQSRDTASKGKTIRSSKLFIKLFGAEGLLAKNYYSRSKKRYRATVFSLAISLVLFISASSFTRYIKGGTSVVDDALNGDNYDLIYGGMTLKEFESVRPQLDSFTTEVSAFFTEMDTAYFTAPNGFTPEYVRKLEFDNESNSIDFAPNAILIYLDDASFERLAGEYGLSMSEFTDPNNRAALIVNKCRDVLRGEKGSITRMETFGFIKEDTETIMLTDAIPRFDPEQGTTMVCWSGNGFGEGEAIRYYVPGEANWKEDAFGRPSEIEGMTEEKLEFKPVKVGAILSNAPVGINKSQSAYLQVIYPMSMYQGEVDRVTTAMYSAEPEQAAKRLRTTLEENGIRFMPSSLHDADQASRTMKNLATIINVFTYGFIALITLISAANVFNTITTNVSLRRRDYAMLRSVGMTKRGMNRMMNYECLLYGSRALIIGLPISILFSWLIFSALNRFASMPFTPPYRAIAIAVISVFAVVFASMLYQTGKIKKDNPIDALRNENV